MSRCRGCGREVAVERVRELVDVVALLVVLADADLFRPDLERAQERREPAGVEALAAATIAPRRLLEVVQLREQVDREDRRRVAERVVDVHEQLHLVGGPVGLVTSRAEGPRGLPGSGLPLAAGVLAEHEQGPPDFGSAVGQADEVGPASLQLVDVALGPGPTALAKLLGPGPGVGRDVGLDRLAGALRLHPDRDRAAEQRRGHLLLVEPGERLRAVARRTPRDRPSRCSARP